MSNEMIVLINSFDIQEVSQTLQGIERFQKVIQGNLKKGHDFDEIPGTNKPTLLKPGAEKILMMMGLTSEYEIVNQVEDWKEGIFHYTVRCILSHKGIKITEGLGSCNSKEDKYRYRWVYEKDIPVGLDKNLLKQNQYNKYRIENDEIFSQVNTLLKMAKKRAQVDAVLTVASLSEIFTQDMEDIKTFEKKEKVENLTTEDAKNMKLTFGKHKGKLLSEIDDTSYIEWLAKNANDPAMKMASEMILNSSKDEVKTKDSKTEDKEVQDFFEEIGQEDIPF